MMNGGIEVDSAPGKGSTFVARVWLENDTGDAACSLQAAGVRTVRTLPAVQWNGIAAPCDKYF